MEAKRQIGIFLDSWDFNEASSFCVRLADGLQQLGHEVTLLIARRYPPRATSALATDFRAMRAAKTFHLLDFQMGKVDRRDIMSHLYGELHKLRFDLLILNQFSEFLPVFNALASDVRQISVGHSDSAADEELWLGAQSFIHRHVVPTTSLLERALPYSPPPLQKRLRVITPGVAAPLEDRPLFQPEIPPEIIYRGPLDFHDKRAEDLPAIWKKYLQLGGTARLHILGEGEAQRWLRRQLSVDISTGTVRLESQPIRAELEELFWRAEVVLSTSNREGLDTLTLEAISSGCYPVLSETRSGHREIVEQIGIGTLCALGDTDAFADALFRLTSPGGRAALLAERQKAQQGVWRAFSAARMVERYESLIQEVLAEPLLQPASHFPNPDRHEVGFWPRLTQARPHPLAFPVKAQNSVATAPTAKSDS